MRKSTKDLQSKEPAEMQKEIQKLVEEIAKLSVDAKFNPQKDSNLIHKKKKELARLKQAHSMKVASAAK